jgi:hypothetical protein
MADFDNDSNLDSGQIIHNTYETGKKAQRVVAYGSLVSEPYDEIDLAYITSGPGAGEIGMVLYKNNDVTVAVLEIEYDSSNRISTIKRI